MTCRLAARRTIAIHARQCHSFTHDGSAVRVDGARAVPELPAAFQSFTVLPISCQGTGIPLNDTATGGPGLSFNPATGAFTYNWATDAGSTGCRRVQLRLGDNSVRELVFRFQ